MNNVINFSEFKKQKQQKQLDIIQKLKYMTFEEMQQEMDNMSDEELDAFLTQIAKRQWELRTHK